MNVGYIIALMKVWKHGYHPFFFRTKFFYNGGELLINVKIVFVIILFGIFHFKIDDEL